MKFQNEYNLTSAMFMVYNNLLKYIQMVNYFLWYFGINLQFIIIY